MTYQYQFENEKIYSTNEVANMLNKSVQTILTWVWKGYLKPIHIGCKNYYKAEDLVKLLESGLVRKNKYPKKRKTANPKKTSICEECLKAFNGCSWSRDRKPVLGWKAKKLNICEYRNIDVYRVISCPEFEEELFYIDEKGVKRRVNEVPDEWKVKTGYTFLTDFLE